MSHESTTRGRRKPDITVVLAVLLPVVLAAFLALTRPDAWSQEAQPPERTPLASATVVCPAGLGDGGTAGVTTLAEGGRGEVRLPGDGRPVDVTSGKVTPVQGAGELSLRTRGAAAPGLLAGRGSVKPLAATDCPATASEQWFTGLGAGPKHDSVIELVNPNKGSAIVDVELFGDRGPVDAPELRGVAVPGESAQTFDLNKVIPREGVLAAHTSVVRGQVAVAVRDGSSPLAAERLDTDWLAGQREPATTAQLLGLPRRGELQELSVANAGEQQVSVTVELITPNAVLEPSGAPTVDVPPESVRTLDVRALLGKKVAEEAIGLHLEGTGPITAGLRTLVEGDPALTPTAAPVSEQTGLVLPTGPGLQTKSLALAGADAEGTVTVLARDAAGKQLASEKVKLGPGRGATLDLPRRTALVSLQPDGITVAGAVRLVGDGVAVVPFRELATSAEVPAVIPGLR